MAVSSTTFDARVARINSGKTAVWVDPETGIRMQRKETHAARMRRQSHGPLAAVRRFAAMGVAGLFGLVAGVAGPVLMMRGITLADYKLEGDMLLAANVAAALAVSFFLVTFLSYRGKLIRLAQVGGVVFMMESPSYQAAAAVGAEAFTFW